MQPHPQVHGGRGENALVGGEQQGRGQIPGQSMGGFRQEIGGRRRDHHEIGVAGQFDMPHLRFIGEREEILMHLRARQRRQRQGRHELRAGLRQHRTDRGTAFAQATHEVERLVGCNATADDQEDARCCEGHSAASGLG